MQLITMVFGEAPNLTSWHMAARTVLIFFIALFLIRISGRRSFSLHSPFDSCTTVLLGAILSRAVVGASPFVGIMAAATALVFLHRATALASVRWNWFERLVSGTELRLADGVGVDEEALEKALVTRKDLKEAIRRKTGADQLSGVAEVVLERNGDITVIPRPTPTARTDSVQP